MANDDMHVVESIADARKPITEYAPFLVEEDNVLVAGVRVLTREEITNALLNFAALSRALPDLLVLSRAHCPGPDFQVLRDEIDLNLSEELGEIEPLPDREGQSHYDALRFELHALLGVDPSDAEIPKPAGRLIDGLKQVMAIGGATTYGALVALEATAIPEITIFRIAVERFAESNQIIVRTALIRFFDAHCSQFEVEHAARLLKMYNEISGIADAIEQMDQGFLQVIAVMAAWWESLRNLHPASAT